jgi:Ca2+/Na+ antiporter
MGEVIEVSFDYGMVVLYLGFLLYMFVALAIVCDEYFVPAIDEITEAFNITPDVAGATLMAAGGSAPELATSFMGVFVSKSEVGFSTIVGSAVGGGGWILHATGVSA